MTTLSLTDLEQVYDQLAEAIDQADAQQQSALFLTKLSLLCAQQLGDATVFEQLIQTALADL